MLKNLSIRKKLLLVLLGPIVALLAISILDVRQELTASSEASDEERRADLSENNGRLFEALRVEAVANQNAVAGGTGRVEESVRTATDAAIESWLARVQEFSALDASGLADDLIDIDTHRLDAAAQFSSGGVGAQEVYEADAALLAKVAAFDGRVGASASELVGVKLLKSSELTSVSLAAADAQLAGLWATNGGVVPSGSLAEKIAIAQAVADNFNDRATAGEQIPSGPPAYDSESEQLSRAAIGASLNVSAANWESSSEERAEILGAARAGVAADANTFAADTSGSARSDMRTSVLLALAGLFTGFGAMLVIGTALRKAVRAVSTDARELAETDMPLLAKSLSGGAAISAADFVRETSDEVGSDEIGEMAEGLTAVRRSATAFLDEVDALQVGVAGTFVNLARRNQALVDRQLEAIDDLEANERDPDRLAQMYRVDHLATRMRRNAESLLVVAGQPPTRRRGAAVDLREVIRVAIGEVEDYRRIIPIALDELAVAGHQAQDLAHLLAELMENATQHSPPGTAVDVLGVAEGEGAYSIRVIDRGTGIEENQLAGLNKLLADTPLSNFSIPRGLGLTVVGRLAQRLGVEVALGASDDGGISAAVLVPGHVVQEWQNDPVEATEQTYTGLDAFDVPTPPPLTQVASPPLVGPFDEIVQQQIEDDVLPEVEAAPVSADEAVPEALSPSTAPPLPDPPVLAEADLMPEADLLPEADDAIARGIFGSGDADIASLPSPPEAAPAESVPEDSGPSRDDIFSGSNAPPVPDFRDEFGAAPPIPVGEASKPDSVVADEPETIEELDGGDVFTFPDQALQEVDTTEVIPTEQVEETTDQVDQDLVEDTTVEDTTVESEAPNDVDVESMLGLDVLEGAIGADVVYVSEEDPHLGYSAPTANDPKPEPEATAPEPEPAVLFGSPDIPDLLPPGDELVEALTRPEPEEHPAPEFATTAVAASEAPTTPAGLTRRKRTTTATQDTETDTEADFETARAGPSRRSPAQVKSMLSRYKQGLERGRSTDGEAEES